ncbi:MULTISPECIES: RNA polymerase sigma factor [Streptomyces diastaticus group]|uniref:Sigma-70 family RNA polymerase sigma factor n=2 Tax=Streptomyces TaxID=1883 RepID=A0ABX6RI58_9ACTN|nr:sigma-70 family RNA polymerase sigma factor [Streptomyces rutgersensis]QNE80352.1 sigma-70 family RNA polymerase sigma factor [Streptomyces rutgersensis]
MTKTERAGWLTRDAYAALRPPLARAAAAEAALSGLDAADLEQAAWLRLLERARVQGPPADPRPGLLAAVRSEARAAREPARRETARLRRPRPLATGPAGCPERRVLTQEAAAEIRRAVAALTPRCRGLLAALLSGRDLTYREIAGTLGISQGSVGPERSRCLGCLRRMLATEVGAPDPGGMER